MHRVSMGITFGEAYATSANLEGVAVWLFYKDAEVMPWEKDRPDVDRLSSGIGRDESSRRQSYGEFAGLRHKRYAPSAHWYLALLGVAPRSQGKGYASVLLRPMLAAIDGEGLPCYLETFIESNVTMYHHFGFSVVEESIVPGSDAILRAMLREPTSPPLSPSPSPKERGRDF